MAEFYFLNFGIKEVINASNIRNPAASAVEIWILNVGIEVVMVASKIQILAAATAEFRIWVLKT